MSDITLGSEPAENSERDAIHVAIYPAIAGQDLAPGDHVSLTDGQAYKRKTDRVGIVDPFLKSKVEKGAKFWLLIYQKSVTGMRHHWQHPLFQDVPEKKKQEDSESVSWLKNYAESVDVTYNELIASANDWVDYGNHLVQGGKFESVWLPDEFWVHYRNVTGKIGSGSFFSCSC
jgi:hypothetical protein